MHIYQHEFVEAFKDWDPERMGQALIKIAELLIGKSLPVEAREDLIWASRESLESVEAHPNISTLVDVLGYDFGFNLSFGVDWTKSPPSRHRAVKLGFDLFSGDEPWPSKWTELGFESSDYVFTRDEVKTPRPLRDEPGHDDQAIPAIHIPAQIDYRPEYSYAYALSVENRVNNNWLDRYRNGQEKEVWQEMLDLKEQIREPEFLPLAIAVVRETMKRCRENIDRLFNSLQAANYPFEYPEEAFIPPLPNVLQKISDLEAKVGALPLSIGAWFEIVGSVNFIADPESEWTEDYPDPIFVSDFDYLFEYDEEKWSRLLYKLEISPDDYHKADVSGGEPYAISLPNPAVDALLENEKRQTTLVDYLRIAFVSSGFPGGLGDDAAQLWQKHKPELLSI